MQHYWGLRGSKLNAAIWGVACFCIMIFGYNQAVAGGVLTTESFQSQFPQMDTIHTTGAQQKYNSTIQGKSSSTMTELMIKLTNCINRNCHCSLHADWDVWSVGLYLSRRSLGTTMDHLRRYHGSTNRCRLDGIVLRVRSIHCLPYRPGVWCRRDLGHNSCMADRVVKTTQSWLSRLWLWDIQWDGAVGRSLGTQFLGPIQE